MYPHVFLYSWLSIPTSHSMEKKKKSNGALFLLLGV